MYYDKIRLIGLYTIDLPIWGLKASDRYILKGADGLDPTGVDVFLAPQAKAGGFYQGRRPQSREISLLVGLIPDYSVNETPSDMRTKLYGLLSPGAVESIEVQLLAGNDGVAKTVGYVKQLSAPPWSSDPAVQIVITCPEPYLSAFESVNTLPPGPGDNTATFSINNVGTAPAGFSWSIQLNTDVDQVTLARVGTTKEFSVYDLDNLRSGTILTVDTRRGRRAVTAKFGAAPAKSILSAVVNDVDLDWFQLYPGLNQFTLTAKLGNTVKTNWIWTSRFYIPQYEGV